MSLSTSFATRGATAFIPKPNTNSFNSLLGSTTPQSRALSVASMPGYMPPKQVSTPYVPPSTPVKSHTTTDSAGNVTKTDYHTPAQVAPNDPSNKYDTSTGKLNTNYKDPNILGENTGIINQPKVSTPSPDNTYKGLIGRGADASQGAYNSGSANYGAANAGLINIAQNGSPDVTKAREGLLNFEKSVADTREGIYSEPTSARVMQGRDQAVQVANAQKEAALSTNVQNALTSQGQQINAGSAALSGGLTGQGQGINGLGTSTGYTAPQPYGLTTQPYNPVTDTYGGGGSNGAVERARLGGQIAAAGTQGAQVEGYKSALQQGQNLQAQLGDLITHFGLNPSDVNAVNTGLQKIAQNVSSPQYKILQNYVNDIANTYAQVLTPPGGSSTDTTRAIATSMLDATASGQSILAVMQSLDSAANAKIAGVNTTPTSSSGSSFSNGQTTSSGGYDFVYQNGKWVAK